jgi:tetratricopeptide (TPR) repeat protein
VPAKVGVLVPLLVVAGLFAPGAIAQRPARWVCARSAHFDVYGDGSAGQIRHIAAQMERLRVLLHELFPSLPLEPVAPLDVLAVRSRGEFQAMAPAMFQARHDPNLAGISQYGLDRNFVLLRLDAASDQHPLRTLYRAYGALLLRRMPGPLPAWEQRGVSELLETAEIVSRQAVIGKPEPAWLQTLRWQPLMPLRELVGTTDRSALFDAQSWALTHLLLIRRSCRLPYPSDGYCGPSPDMQRALADYIRRPAYPERTVNLAPVKEKAIAVVELTAAAASAVEADYLAHIGRSAEAARLAQGALTAGGSATRAEQALGLLALGQGDDAAARRQYCAAAADPQDFLAAYRCGVLTASAAPAAAEDELKRVIRLRPVFAPAYDQLALLYSRRWEELETAEALERQAIGIEPANPLYPHNLAWIGQREQQYSRFETFLDPPQTGPQRQVSGTISAVSCASDPRGASFPIKLTLDTAAGAVHLQARDLLRISFEAANFTPSGAMHACRDLQGLRAQITAAGNRILAVSLSH